MTPPRKQTQMRPALHERSAPQQQVDATSLTLHVGNSGMGKTYALTKIVEAYARKGWLVVIVDANHEWGRVSTMGTVVAGPNGADAAVKRGAKVIVWSCGDHVGAEPDVDAACAWVLKRGRGTLVAIPEAHTYFPLHGKVSKVALEVLTRYRHRGLSVILDTQRLATLNTKARNNARPVRIFGVIAPTDLVALREWGGPELERAAILCAEKRAQGTPGYFIDFDPYAPKRNGEPYPIRRL